MELLSCFVQVKISNLFLINLNFYFKSSLEPHLLRKAVYPFLISYVDEETVHNTDLILTHSAVQTENVHLFLLDSFFVIIVYYLEKLSGESNKEEHIAKSFPPSKDSKLNLL